MKNSTKKEALLKLKIECSKCEKCPLAKLGRIKPVSGEGNIDTKIMFIGEAPGKNEDLLEHVFIGRSGNLLTKILEEAGIKREDIYISNVVKCRPPENRTPNLDEIETCKENFLLKEISIINPTIICTLGSSSTKALLGNKISITEARGKIHSYNNHLVIPTYHPAYLLRNQSKKIIVLEDILKILKTLSPKSPY